MYSSSLLVTGSARLARFGALLLAVFSLLSLSTSAWAQVKAEEDTHHAAAAAHAPAAVADVHDTHGAGEHAATAHHEEHGLPQAAPVLHKLFGFIPINSSMVLTWIVAAIIIAFAQYATRQVREVPEGAQNVWEFLVEGLRDFLENIIGRPLTSKTFWFFATIFIFILSTNWFGLLPGVGTIGWGHPDAHGHLHHISRPLFRGANADLNMTLAMSMIFFVCWTVWAFQANGPGGFFLHIFGPKGKTVGFMKVVMIVVFALVGVLEIVSIIFRPVSLSFRLYGNIFAGENMLEAMANLVPSLAGIIPIPFYFMELLVGFVQALVFMLLTAVFTLLICSHGDEPHSGDHQEHH